MKILIAIPGTLLAAWVVVLFMGFFGLKFGLTDVKGKVDGATVVYQEATNQSRYLKESPVPTLPDIPDKPDPYLRIRQENLCKLFVLSDYYPQDVQTALAAYTASQSDASLPKLASVFSLHVQDQYVIERLAACTQISENTFFSPDEIARVVAGKTNESIFQWQNSKEWHTIARAMVKDADVIHEISAKTGVSSRLIASITIVEQLRLYHTQRELFEKFFKPLDILANATKSAWGVMGIKEKTATSVESNLKNSSSVFYLGPTYEHVLDFTNADIAGQRFARLTDEHNHTYSYLYGALYLRQIMHQWEAAGYSIVDRPEILATLFNVGFRNSSPKPNPEVGGSTLSINGVEYTFGGLAYEFYYSGTLYQEFPLSDT